MRRQRPLQKKGSSPKQQINRANLIETQKIYREDDKKINCLKKLH